MRLRPRRLPVRTRLTVWYTSVLLVILIVVSALSYSLLRRSLIQDLDASLTAVALVIRDANYPAAGATPGPGTEEALRELLGSEFDDKFFQLVVPEGRPGLRSGRLRDKALPVTAGALQNAGRGIRTFETVRLSPSEPVRLLTMPVVRDGTLVQLVQVGIPLHRTQQTLRRYLQTLLVLVPLGVALAAGGGALIARTALAPVNDMSWTARRITAEDLSSRIALRGTRDELDHLGGTLNAMLARLEDAFAQTRRFAAHAAHELRTPLTALKGGIEVALRAGRSPEEYRRVLRSSLEDVEHLIKLAEDLLLLSRSSTAPEGPWARVDLEPLLLGVLDLAARLAEGRGVAVRLGETAPVVVLGDALTLHRAILNVVENAIKYTPPGGKVELSLVRDAPHAVVRVQDTGPGISPSDAERIFEPFVRLEAARARESVGAGLGLAIARSVVHAHNGTLSLESVSGAGSRFTFRLPLD